MFGTAATAAHSSATPRLLRAEGVDQDCLSAYLRGKMEAGRRQEQERIEQNG
jgi:hypothetical protein